MKSSRSKTIAGFCQKCNSQVYLAGGRYFCQCGEASEHSYHFPASWSFASNRSADALKSKAAAKAGSSDGSG